MIHPAELVDILMGLRIDPLDLTAEVLAPFGPLLTRVDPRQDKRLAILAKLIAECANVHNAITWLLEHAAVGLRRGLLRRDRPFRPRLHGLPPAQDAPGQ